MSRAAQAKSLSALFAGVGAAGASFEDTMLFTSKRVMRHLIAPLLPQMGITSSQTTPVAFLDSACGSGLITQELQATLPKDILEKSSFICADFSEGLVNMVKKRIAEEEWINTEAKVLDAQNTGLPAHSFTHIGMGLALHLIPNPDAVLADCQRLLKSGGVFGATTFHHDNQFWFPDLGTAFASFPFEAPFPEKPKMQMHDSGDWTDVEWIDKHLREKGFADVQVNLCPGTYHIESADEYIMSFGMMFGWLMNSHWDEETRKAHPLEEVKQLVRDHLVEKYDGKGWDINWLVITMTGRVE